MSTTQQETLSIDGMHCEHCVDVVRDALSSLDGVTVDDIDVGHATISHDGSVPRKRLAAVLDDAGYSLAQ